MSKRSDHLDLARTDLAATADNLAVAERRMMDARPGVPGAVDPNATRGNSELTPTERAADQRMRGDRTQHDIDQLDRALREIGRYSLIARRIVESWTPHPATDRDRLEVGRANLEPVPGCVHHHDFGEWAPVHRTSNVGGNLPHPIALCRWCYDRCRSDGRLPSADRMQRLKDGKADRVRA